MLNQTALLFFTRTAASEAANKPFVPENNKRINLKIATLLIENTRQATCASGLPTYEINEQQQEGSNFGERLSNAMEAVYNEGFKRLIVIGNDCCTLKGTLIEEANHKLQQHDLVLGPDNHGGVYLIGIHKTVFDKASFSLLQWQTPELFKDLQTAFSHTPFYQLPVLTDANNFFDLVKLKNQLPFFNAIRTFIISILDQVLKHISYLPIQYSNPLFFLSALRAPPAL